MAGYGRHAPLCTIDPAVGGVGVGGAIVPSAQAKAAAAHVEGWSVRVAMCASANDRRQAEQRGEGGALHTALSGFR